MGAFAFRREHDQAKTRRTGRSRPPNANRGAPPAARREPVDDQIDSLLVSLEQAPETVSTSVAQVPNAAVPAATVPERRAQWTPGAARAPIPWRRRFGQARRGRVDRTDLVFVLTAVVLGVAIGVLTPLL